ncbi:hypothetical protein [Mycobacterium sp.]|uniref:hypothetical protein n=1 Tax=Mycobacterium sp. TaxID=1785 RepID=UPI0012774C68|nr:hypothetical protein [Mycobacterium sp.]KAA8957036.1 MAG: hypothetical protein F6Q13_16725 [Mycobacterium sp.]
MTTMAADALAMAMMSSRAVADSDPSGALQPVIDQLLGVEQQVTDTDSQYLFIDPSQLPMLHTFVQDMALTMLGTQFGASGGTALGWAPYEWSAPASNPQEFLVLPNPDDQYSNLQVEPGATYTITVEPGPGTQNASFTAESGSAITGDATPVTAIDLANATPNPNGTYTITLSSVPQSGNWLDTAGAQTVLIRDTVGDWGQIHDSFTVQEVGGPATNTAALLSDSQISSMLSTVVADMPATNASSTYLGQPEAADMIPNNTFLPIEATSKFVPGITLPGQEISVGHYSLEPDQALIVKVPDIDAAYSGLQLANDWGDTAPYATVQGSLNDTQAFHDPNGYTYYVISDQDPGVANWVDDSGINDGSILLRWQDVTGPIPSTAVADEVVNVADVRNYLPADTPVVTPEEYAADFNERLLEYDYVHDQNGGLGWLGANLRYDQVNAAMGPDQFHEIFGGQTGVPSILDRLTPTFSPDLVTLAHDVVTNPGGSLTAIINNLPLAIQDVELPTVLAALQLSHATEFGGLETVLSEAFTDPANSITAGVLNARDDLAVAVMNASSSTAMSDTLWNSLLELNHELLSTLVNLVG